MVALSGAASAQKGDVYNATPTKDIVGKGLFNCAVVTGEIGFSPATVASGGTGTTETVSIWFDASKCSAVPGSVVKPVPSTVIGSESFISNLGNFCPQLSPPSLGAGTLNLTYNFPPVPNPIVDPTVGQSITVNGAASWTLTGLLNAGSYTPAPNFTASLHPVLVGAQNCTSGVNSMFINHGTLSNV